MGLCNGVGRLLSGSLSDRVGRETVLRGVFSLNIVACLLFLPSATSYAQGFIGMCIAAFCFGAGIAMMPSTNADYFGSKHLGANYGMMFTGFAISGFFGPKIVADIVQHNPTQGYRVVFWAFAGISLVGLILSIFLRKPRSTRDPDSIVQ
jgi:MFS family permease